ncbi:MAG: type II/IV secretion system ATPase subunit [Candidatus Heimdallarchaeota archaeon]|nr:type II/IV secretion system ATPase subunit [Candidatus Heimdallarchaeota archaeon]MCK5047997.1 type II/IV secretion system ATPase subunit [Candidatus Heimdallarchaeota archaeon]
MNHERLHVIDSYKVNRYSVSILEAEKKKYYYVSNDVNDNVIDSLFYAFRVRIFSTDDAFFHSIQSFQEIFSNLSMKAVEFLDEQEMRHDLVDILVSRLLGIDKLYPLFIDNHINEIYQDSFNFPIYIDHEVYGRCETSIILTSKDLECLITRLKIENNLLFDRNNPSLKTELISSRFRMRITIDQPPIAADGISFNIRKFRKMGFSLTELINNNTLTKEAAEFLIKIMNRRRNITIIGEPGSGKTTLANAIDLLTPDEWRKVTIEDAIETVNQLNLGKHQLRIKVPSLESSINITSKTQEIIKLLHRTPEYVFLGEIQTPEHSKAMFEALGAGLKGIQTTHSDSLENIIKRWVFQHDIKMEQLNALDCVVIMRKEILRGGKITRKVLKIYSENNDGKIIIQLNGQIIAFDEVYSDTELCSENSIKTDLAENSKENLFEIEKSKERQFHFTNSSITDLSQAGG